MKDFFRLSFASSKKEPQFVTTQGISYYLETMFKEATQWIVIVSPFVKINMRMSELLQERKNAGVHVTIVHREDFANSTIASQTFQRKNLHSKCFVTENAALIGSMNLYDYSQVHNDEMGIYIPKKSCPTLYAQITDETTRLCKHFPEEEILPKMQSMLPGTSQKNASPIMLEKGKKYTQREMEKLFRFIDAHSRGIKQTVNGNVVLFCKSNGPYTNEEKDDVLYYQGQNTGQGAQQLIYGNKTLHDCFKNSKTHIFLFKDGLFCGEKYICKAPFQREGRWIFPLKDKEQ